MNPFIEDITLAVFQKDWKNLLEIHKIIKIKEYVEKMQQPLSEKKKVMHALIALVKSKKLANKLVQYNYETRTIEYIDATTLESLQGI